MWLCELRIIVAIILLALSIVSSSRAGVQIDHRPQWRTDGTLTYNLEPDPEGVRVPALGAYMAWGNLMSSFDLLNAAGLGRQFTKRTLAPYDVTSKDLFVVSSVLGLHRVTYTADAPLPSPASWTFPMEKGGDGDKGAPGNVVAPFGPDDQLIRYYHFKNTLLDEMSPGRTQIGESTEKLIVLIHGWNPDSDADSFSTFEFTALQNSLKYALAGSGWSLVLYHWEPDADTGPAFPEVPMAPVKAAHASHLHGLHLGELIRKSCPHLKSVHFIAHSAGSWAARAASISLITKGPRDLKFQVTLLDPFMPAQMPATPLPSPLGRDMMSQLHTVLGSTPHREWLLENYYARDLPTNEATWQVFDWGGVRGDWHPANINQRVDWVDKTGYDNFDSHAGPIFFYSSTVLTGNLGTFDPLDPLHKFRNSNGVVLDSGWTLSLFRNEPLIPDAFQPKDVTVAAAGKAEFSAEVYTRNGYEGGPVDYVWECSTDQGATWAPYLASEGDTGMDTAKLTIGFVKSGFQGQSGWMFRLKATTEAGTVTSKPATLLIEDAPVILQQMPESRQVALGQTVNLSVTAIGKGITRYYWERSNDGGTTWNAVTGLLYYGGATESQLTLTITDMTFDQAKFRMKLQNEVAPAVSTICTLTVAPAPPVITSLTPAGSVGVPFGGNGSPLEFRVAATGAGTLNYAWRVGRKYVPGGGSAIGGSSPSLFLPLPNTDGSPGTIYPGYYWVEVSNAGGTTVSNPICVSSGGIPVDLRTTPRSLVVKAGETFSLTVDAYSFTDHIDYIWQTVYGYFESNPTYTSNTLVVDQPPGGMTYSCILGSRTTEGGYAVSYSDDFNVDVIAPPVWGAIDIVDRDVDFGGTTNLTAVFSVPIKTSPTSYEAAALYDPKLKWYRNGTELSGGKFGTLTISDFGPEDEGTYTVFAENWAGSVTGTVARLHMIHKPVTITWNDPQAITYGEPLSSTELSATANTPGTFTYSPDFGAVVPAGDERELRVTFTPYNTTDYKETSALRHITVNKATPSLSWPYIESIVYGTPLSEVQLNASAENGVTGAFYYQASDGTTLRPGSIITSGISQWLKATFVPYDSLNYGTASIGNFISVDKKPLSVIPYGRWRVYGDPAPLFDPITTNNLRYEGFIPGDSHLSLEVQPYAWSLADQGSDAGEYAIQTAGGTSANYSFVYGQAVLQIAPASATVELQKLSQTYDGNPKPVDVVTTPAGAGFETRYNGSTTAPTQAGSYQVSVSIQSKNYVGSGSGSLVIEQAVPQVQWKKPPVLHAGVPLGGAQLNATCDVPGFFTYNPAAGKVYEPGQYMLAVHFDPVDTVNYTWSGGVQTLDVDINPIPRIFKFTGGIALEGSSFTLAPEVVGPGVLGFKWYHNGVEIAGANGAALVFEKLPRAAAGTYRFDVTNENGTVASTTVMVEVLAATDRPVITAPPASVTQPPGSAITLSVATLLPSAPAGAAAALGETYQWFHDGVAIDGATGPTLSLPALSEGDAGDYTVAVTNASGTVTSRPARVTVAVPSPGNLRNLSVRTFGGTAGRPVIVGFVPQGGNVELVLRGAGPGLVTWLTGYMENPMADLYQTIGSTDTIVNSNDNWGNGPGDLATRFASVGAFPLGTGSFDAALVANADSQRTLHVRPVEGTQPGVVLVEAYDTGLGGSGRLVNVSARNYAGTGANALIAGFSIGGNVPKRVLVRGIGPGLAPFGVTGWLVDPQIDLYPEGNSTALASNDNWLDEVGAQQAFGDAGAFGLPIGSLDSSLVILLPAGNYTAVVADPRGSTGEALVEVYELP